MVKIEYLADHPEWIHLIAFMHQLEMRTASDRNFDRSIQRFSERMNRHTLPMTLVAVEDTIPVGSVSLLEHQLDSHLNLSPWVASLFVLEQYRNLGIGIRLMQEIEMIASAIGHTSLFLFTHTAKAYYENRGWKTIDTVRPPEVSHSSVVMSKSLSIKLSVSD